MYGNGGVINKFVEMRYDIVVNSSKAQSIGIIGGVDGPSIERR
jgi:Na+-transporting methylmalonyl-CoA/oxaloacetate decarboxylase beta subunit